MKEQSEWTVDTLKEFLLRIIEEHYQRHIRTEVSDERLRISQRNEMEIAIKSVESMLEAAMKANQEAVLKVEMATEKRFESVNAFRQTMADLQTRFVTRVELDGFSQRLQDLTDRVNLWVGKGSGLNAGWQYLVATIGAISALLVIWITVRGH